MNWVLQILLINWNMISDNKIEKINWKNEFTNKIYLKYWYKLFAEFFKVKLMLDKTNLMHSINSPGKKIRTPFPVPYARSKLQQIFQNFNKCIKQSNNFLVRNHHVPLNMSVKGSRTYTQASSVTDYILE